MNEELLNNIRSRPRFKLRTDLSTKEYAEHLRKFLDAHSDEFTGIINQQLSTIMIRTEENPYFKPRLTLSVEKEYGTGDTVIRGMFGPSQGIWTMFLFSYGIATLGFLFFSFWYMVQLTIDSREDGWTLYATLFSLLVFVATWLIARHGRRESQQEIVRLRHFAEQSTAPHARAEVARSVPQSGEAGHGTGS